MHSWSQELVHVKGEEVTIRKHSRYEAGVCIHGECKYGGYGGSTVLVLGPLSCRCEFF